MLKNCSKVLINVEKLYYFNTLKFKKKRNNCENDVYQKLEMNRSLTVMF